MIKPPKYFWLTPLLLAGCVDATPTTPGLENSVFSLLGGLEVGEELQLSGAGADTVLLNGGPSGAEYLYVPFFASESGQARLQLEVRGSNLQAQSGGASRAVLASRTPFGDESLRLRLASDERHVEFRTRSMAELEPLIPQARSALAQASLSRGAAEAVVPTVGQVIPINVPTGSSSCRAPRTRQGRVMAVSRGAIIVADTGNPAGGFTAADYEAFARTFDELIHPVVTRHFGEPTDIDRNGRAFVFFTRAVNEMPGVAGFFWGGDLYPKSVCPGSNQGEIFYQMVPDPQGQISGRAYSLNLVRTLTPGIVGHEYQHLINAGRRMYVNDAEDWEEAWLDEGLSHMAEELLFYAASGLQPGRNLTLQQLVTSQQTLAAVNTYQVSNLFWYSYYLESVDEASLTHTERFTDGVSAETRGASWAFLRYAADHHPDSDEQLFRKLVNSRYSGVENLSRALGRDALELMRSWTTSVYTDDFVSSKNPLHRQPSWNFRDIVPALYEDEKWPLKTHALNADKELSLRLRGGGTAFVTLRGAASRQALLATTSGGRLPPERLQVTIIRTR